jgi:uncharacterized protein (DUF427 family)
MKAIWKGSVIAESEDTVVVEGNHYFPLHCVDAACLQHSDTTSYCPWKGDAHYYSVVIEGDVNVDAVWYYPSPKEAAVEIADRVAFSKGVEVTA